MYPAGEGFSDLDLCGLVDQGGDDYILRSWSLVGISTTINQKKLFFNLVTAKRQRSVFQEGDLRPQRVSLIAAGLGVAANDVVDMNRRLSGDISLNVSLNQDGFRGVARPAGDENIDRRRATSCGS